MSFGWSVGDLIAGANLTYILIKNLSDTQGACIEYQEAISELGALQQAFLRIEHIRASAKVDRAVINSAIYLVTSSMGMIGDFLEKTKKYRQQMHAGSPGSMVSSNWLKAGWALFRKDELVALRVSLNMKLTALTLLLTTANLCEDALQNNPIRKYQMGDSFESSNEPLSRPSTTDRSTSQPTEHDNFTDSDREPNESEGGMSSVGARGSPLPSPYTPPENMIPPPDLRIEFETNIQKLLEWRKEEGKKWTKAIADIEAQEPHQPKKQKPIKFKDAVGRKFSFPYHLCATWAGMEDLIKQAFLHVEVIGPHVAEGHYDLIGPNGEIILPQVWETMIEPDLSITMHMWPMPEPLEKPAPIVPPDILQAASRMSGSGGASPELSLNQGNIDDNQSMKSSHTGVRTNQSNESHTTDPRHRGPMSSRSLPLPPLKPTELKSKSLSVNPSRENDETVSRKTEIRSFPRDGKSGEPSWRRHHSRRLNVRNRSQKKPQKN